MLVGFGALQMTTGEEKLPTLLWGFTKLLGLWKLIPDGRATAFYNIQTRREKLPQEFIADVQALFALLSQGKLHPAIAETASFEDVVEIHRKIDSAKIAGKVVLLCH